MIINIIKKLLLVNLLFLCACTTAYQSKGFFGDGYSEVQLSEDIFQVYFTGNGDTSFERVMDYALLRAAEIMEYHDYKKFVVIDNNKSTEQAHVSYSYKNSGTTLTSTSNSHTVIIVVRGLSKNDTDSNAYNTKITIRTIKQKYKLK